jgi:LacI family gluconate utilization system Gnt-I transcriptional repressor
MSGATLDDVAVLARVSPSTVSRFINKPSVVSPETATRIREAIERTGYIPNLLAGGLASAKSGLVAVLIPHFANSIFDATIEAMVEELAAGAMNVTLGLTGLDPARTDKVIRSALSRRVDAIILTGEPSGQVRDVLHKAGKTVIQIWELPDDPIDVAIGFSHIEVGRDIARFAYTRGYKRPHIITANGGRAKMRRAGFVNEWTALDGGPLTDSIVDIPSRFGHARRAFAEIRRLKEQPDVVICGTDLLALGMIMEAQASGLRVPEDLAVLGFGNSAIAGETRPTITSVDIDGARIGREAIAVIRRRLAGENPSERRIDVGFRLIARESA